MNTVALSRENPGNPTLVLFSLAVLCWMAAALMTLAPGWRQVEFSLLDNLIVASAPNKSAFPITLIGIDEASFSSLKLQWPWPRRMHAELIDRLVAGGAAVIVLDMLIAEPSNAEDDRLLADAIRRAGNVVLVADRVYRESSSVRQWVRLDPLPMLKDAGAQAGVATVELDRDQVVRRVPDATDALWRAVILRLLQKHPELSPSLGIAPGSLIRYVGGDHSFPYLSYHEVLKQNGSIPEDFFRDQIVIVGRDVKASPDAGTAAADLFGTPFLASTGWLMPGAEIHANIIETMLARNAITALPDGLLAVLLAAVAAASALAMRRWRPLWSALAGVALVAMICFVVWAAFARWNLWIPAGSALAIVPLMYVSLGGWSYIAEQARRKQITRAFSLYVTPQVVDYLIANPGQIRLGGERRQITTMFTDLAGFTTFSELLSPERVTLLLNRHFTEMTDIVLEHHGTVVQFIGDAIMAFWGAPLDDDDQAYRAVAAAIKMQQAMAALRVSFASEGLPPVHMRIGIHSGSAVVGNLGSAKRFGYTAVGDDVNLAARLEGINKLYGTDIMVSSETMRQIGGRIGLRAVDRVVVKGKSQAIDVFTPCDDPVLVELTERAVRHYRNREWDAAETCLHQMLTRNLNDKFAELYLQRIARFRLCAPVAQWNGATELEKL